ncbi:hypothetical protein OG352_06660 [Streptomyces sp. NBC_01485]|uniref:hypothetical protein n=1 Tax=Streptomyces sp. NBC_01485 TaxID=2903884 RepID=UPI002E32D94C|nr:hypothetical protein [Streptomyces sp. NBC_01485]
MNTTIATPEYVALLEHGTTCPTCMAMDKDGKNLGLPCEPGDRIYQAYRQTLRGPAAPPQTGA